MADISDDDDISITSTAASEAAEDGRYNVSRILAQSVDRDGKVIYLLEWEGYPLTRSTWEPEKNLEDDGTLDEWEQEKQRIANGQEPFDVMPLLDEIQAMNEEKEARHKRRVHKRERLQRAVSPSTKSWPEPIFKNEDSDNESQAFEVEDEVDTLNNTRQWRPARASKTKSQAAFENASDTELGPGKKRKRQQFSVGAEESEGLSDDSLVQEALLKKKKRDQRRSSIQDQPVAPTRLKDKGKAKAVRQDIEPFVARERRLSFQQESPSISKQPKPTASTRGNLAGARGRGSRETLSTTRQHVLSKSVPSAQPSPPRQPVLRRGALRGGKYSGEINRASIGNIGFTSVKLPSFKKKPRDPQPTFLENPEKEPTMYAKISMRRKAELIGRRLADREVPLDQVGPLVAPSQFQNRSSLKKRTATNPGDQPSVRPPDMTDWGDHPAGVNDDENLSASYLFEDPEQENTNNSNIGSSPHKVRENSDVMGNDVSISLRPGEPLAEARRDSLNQQSAKPRKVSFVEVDPPKKAPTKYLCSYFVCPFHTCRNNSGGEECKFTHEMPPKDNGGNHSPGAQFPVVPHGFPTITCRWWATSGCEKEDGKCNYAHGVASCIGFIASRPPIDFYSEECRVAPHQSQGNKIQPRKPISDSKEDENYNVFFNTDFDPNKSHMTCYYWADGNRCKFSDSECKFIHADTGRIAQMPGQSYIEPKIPQSHKSVSGPSINTANNEAILTSDIAERRVIIRNLRHGTTQGDLSTFFEDFTVESILFPGRPGVALIDLVSPAEARKAVAELSSKQLNHFYISLAISNNPAGGRSYVDVEEDIPMANNDADPPVIGLPEPPVREQSKPFDQNSKALRDLSLQASKPNPVKISMAAYKARQSHSGFVSITGVFGASLSNPTILILVGMSKNVPSPLIQALDGISSLIFDQFCLATDFSRLASEFSSQVLAYGAVSVNEADNEKLAAITDYLKSSNGGLMFSQPTFSILLFPARVEDWKFLETQPFDGDVLLRYHIFATKADLTSTAFHATTRKFTTLENHVEKPHLATLSSNIFGLDYDKFLPASSENYKNKPFFLLFPTKASELSMFLAKWLRACNKFSRVYTGDKSGSWACFTEQHMSVGGTVLIHSSMVPKLYKLPRVRKLVLTSSIFTFWSICEGSAAESIFLPSRTTHSLVFAGEISSVRILPHGGAVFLTPSFLQAEPVKLLHFLRWFRGKIKLVPHTWKIVACHNLSGYLLDLANERALALKELEENRKTTKSTDTHAEEVAASRNHCMAVYVSYQQVLEILHDAVDISPIVEIDEGIDSNDEKSLVSRFAFWTLSNVVNFRKFLVIGTTDEVRQSQTKTSTPPKKQSLSLGTKPIAVKPVKSKSTIKVSAIQSKNWMQPPVLPSPMHNEGVDPSADTNVSIDSSETTRSNSLPAKLAIDAEAPSEVLHFIIVTQAPRDVAEKYLASADNNLQKAVELYHRETGGAAGGLDGVEERFFRRATSTTNIPAIALADNERAFKIWKAGPLAASPLSIPSPAAQVEELVSPGRNSMPPSPYDGASDSSTSKVSRPSSRAGIITDTNDRRVVPSSRRDSGTVRPERLVKPGFVPQEDVELYRYPKIRNEATQCKTGSAAMSRDNSSSGANSTSGSKVGGNSVIGSGDESGVETPMESPGMRSSELATPVRSAKRGTHKRTRVLSSPGVQSPNAPPFSAFPVHSPDNLGPDRVNGDAAETTRKYKENGHSQSNGNASEIRHPSPTKFIPILKTKGIFEPTTDWYHKLRKEGGGWEHIEVAGADYVFSALQISQRKGDGVDG